MPLIIFSNIVLIVIGLANFWVGFWVFTKNPQNPIHTSFFLFVAGAAVWTAGIALLAVTKIFFFDKIIFYGGTLMILGLVLFAKTFPSAGVPSKKFFWSLLPFVFVFVAIPFSVFIKGLEPTATGDLRPINGPAFPLFVVTMSFYLILSIFLLTRKYFVSTGAEKLKMRYFFLGLFTFVCGVLVFDIVLPAIQIFHLNLLGPATSVIFIGFTAYAIVRHQLLDIRVVIQQGLIYTVLLALVIGLYLGLIGIVGYFFRQITDLAVLFSAGFTLMIGIFGVPVIEKQFRRATDKIFFKDKYDYARAMQELSEILNKNFETTVIAQKSEQKLMEIFKSKEARIFLYTKNDLNTSERPKEEHFNNEASLPISIGTQVVGRLYMGPRRSEDAYTEEDVRLLRTFCHQAAVAFEKTAVRGSKGLF